MPLRSVRNIVAVSLVFGGLSLPVKAASISFASPTTSSGDSDVVNTGATVEAFSLSNAGASVLVNGVTFTGVSGAGASPITLDANTTLTVASNSVPANTSNGAGNAYSGGVNNPFASLNAGYQSLLAHGVYNDAVSGNAVFTITFNNLTVNQQYLVEPFVNDSRGGASSNRTISVAGGGGSAVSLKFGNGTAGGLGQFTTGTFTADSTTQAVTFTGPNAQLNAIQLRAVPEPTSLALLATGALGLLIRRGRSERR